MKKKREDLSASRVLLTEAGEQQWLDNLLDEATAQEQQEKQHTALGAAAAASPKRARKAA